MPDYRVRLRLQGPLATPLQSGTLFGHLCWALRWRDGEGALTDWLAALEDRPLLLSDAFPAGCLPRPLLAPAPLPEPRGGESRNDFRARMEGDKALRKRAWIAVDDWLALRGNLNEARLMERLRASPAPESARSERVRLAHNTIDRLTGTTPDSGGLYFMDETWHDPRQAAERDVYLRAELPAGEVEDLFRRVGESGFGRDAALGRGRFGVTVTAADPALFDHAGNRLLSLAHGLLTANMAEPRYKLHTHYGKLGGLYAGGARSPFKQPLSLLRPGATFAPADGGPFGALLAGVHPQHPEVRHHAWHLCLPYTETAH